MDPKSKMKCVRYRLTPARFLSTSGPVKHMTSVTSCDNFFRPLSHFIVINYQNTIKTCREVQGVATSYEPEDVTKLKRVTTCNSRIQISGMGQECGIEFKTLQDPHTSQPPETGSFQKNFLTRYILFSTNSC